MGFYQFQKSQKIPADLERVWDFIASPQNLQKITPNDMEFKILSEIENKKMYQGMIIKYRVKPLLGIALTWVTEITTVVDNKYFVDEQRVGPYSIWHHQHFLEPIKGGVLMRDVVSYKPPLGFMGALFNSLLIRKKLIEIFEYRTKVLEQIFGKF